jgi:hypothetical protein
LERALWVSLRTLEESASLLRRMALRARNNGQLKVETRYLRRVQEREQEAKVVRDMLERVAAALPDDAAPPSAAFDDEVAAS